MKHGIIFKMTHKWKKWQSYCLITACIAGWGFFAWAFTMSPYFMSEIGYTAFCNSFGIPKKYGITWIERAAEKGSNDAQYFMGRLYLEGEDGIGRNYKEAEKWFRMGAEEGNMWLAFCLGNLYSEGGYGIDKDYSEAVKWYRAVADSWDNDARVTYALGEIYEEGGYGINQDLEEALKWYRLTEETGYYYENLEAKIQELERDIYAVPVDSAC